MAAAAPTALALEIKKVRQRVGSHDKLVARLKDGYGLTKASRTLVINWEKNAVPTGGYRDALVDLGVDERLFAKPEVTTQPAPIAVMLEALDNQREMKDDYRAVLARLGSLEEKVGEVADLVTSVLEALADAQEPGQAAES